MSELAGTIDLTELEIGDEIGSGGQAVVYRVRNHHQILYKEYRGVRIDPDGIDRLITWRKELGAEDRELLDRSASWPQSRVLDGESTVGVLIPEAPERFKIEVRGSTRLNEVQYLAFGDRAKKLGLELPGPGERAEVIATFADLLELFDRHRIVHGDISFKNVLWTIKGNPGTYLLDCDGARQGRHQSPLPQVTTQHWTDPRVQSGTIEQPDVDSDRLALGLLFFRTYFQVRANFTGIDLEFDVPHRPPLNRSVDKLIENTLHSRSGRSSANDWQRIRHLPTFLEHNGFNDSDTASAARSASAAPTYGARPATARNASSAPPTYDPTAPEPTSTPTSAQTASTSSVGSPTQASARKPLRKNPIFIFLLLTCVILATVAILLAAGVGR